MCCFFCRGMMRRSLGRHDRATKALGLQKRRVHMLMLDSHRRWSMLPYIYHSMARRILKDFPWDKFVPCRFISSWLKTRCHRVVLWNHSKDTTLPTTLCASTIRRKMWAGSMMWPWWWSRVSQLTLRRPVSWLAMSEGKAIPRVSKEKATRSNCYPKRIWCCALPCHQRHKQADMAANKICWLRDTQAPYRAAVTKNASRPREKKQSEKPIR